MKCPQKISIGLRSSRACTQSCTNYCKLHWGVIQVALPIIQRYLHTIPPNPWKNPLNREIDRPIRDRPH